MAVEPRSEVRSRRRSVRLSTSGLQLLVEGLDEAWATHYPGRKLTRELKAEILGVSPRTADRVLSQQGVDLATLRVAFQSVGIAWRDEFCELTGLEVTVEPQSVTQRRPFPWRLAVSLGLVSLMATAFLVGAKSVPADPFDGKVSNMINEATELYHKCSYDRAEAMLQEALVSARKRRDAGQMASAQRVLADIAIFRGDFAAAESRLQECVDLRRSLHQPNMLPSLYEALGDVGKSRRHFGKARSYYNLALEGFSAEKEPVGIALVQRDLGSLSLMDNDLVGAKNWFQKARRCLANEDKPDIIADITAREAEVLMKEGKYAEARSNLLKAAAHWKAQNHTRWIAQTELLLAHLDEAEGERDQCLASLERARTGFTEVGDVVGQRQVDAEIARIR